MKHTQIIVLFLAFSGILAAQSGDRYAYIEKYKDIAISEMERAGVPASIKLAQGILESAGGTSYLARKGNNHFGVKCGSRWTGKKVYRKDDDYDENGKLRESCFRAYKNAEASYIAHSDFLRDNPRYDFLFRLNPYDYKAWARGLKRAGYATSATYSQKLIKVIETYELSQYDQMDANDVIAENSETYQEKLQGITTNNDVKLVLAQENETPQRVADRTRVSVRKILKYNEKLTDPNQRLARDERVYLQSKRDGFRGRKKYHYVQAGESIYDIAQLYGVTTERLRERNRIDSGLEAAFGERLKLRGFKIFKSKTPKTIRNVNTAPPVIIDPPPVRDNTDDDRDETAGSNSNTNTPNADNIDPITPANNNGRRPVLTSDTGERDDNFYPPPPEPTSPVTPEVKVNDPAPVYVPPTPNQPTNTNPNPTPVPSASYHTVDTGDTLYNISRRYGLTVQELMTLNGMDTTVIRKGQKLRVQ